AKEIMRLRDKINELINIHTGQEIDKVKKDTDRDYFMSSEEAKDYGVIDGVIYPKQKNKKNKEGSNDQAV
ncbi:MAG TPA: ATP-dependent Clp protease proteolytic subunit, partial [Candidatus Omnitrophica bacterium]|nr:ATP-dependent Clp protease proteolytic subunit [Candidatus Omnitrophota bacterium]